MIKNKLYKQVTITVERMVEEKTDEHGQENTTLYWLINSKVPSGRGVGFRADTPIEVWSKLMHEIYL